MKQYYTSRKEICKNKHSKKSHGAYLNVRYLIKEAIYNNIYRNDYNRTMSRFREAYHIIRHQHISDPCEEKR